MARLIGSRQLRGTAPPAWVAPVANADSVSGGIVNQAMVIHAATLLANDTVDPRGTLAIQSVQNPIGCTISLNVSAQDITLTPVQVTPVSFQYTAIDTNAFTASATVTLPSVTAAPPPSGLPQKVIGPPQLSNPTVIQITNATNNAQVNATTNPSGKWVLNSGTDYRIQFMEVMTARVWFIGGNKVHIGWGPTASDYGGDITSTGDGVSCLIVEDMQSECWIEGMVCRKNTTHGHCFQIRCGTTSFPVWILNCYADKPLPVNPGGGGSALSVHDGVCPKITVDGFTDVTYGTGISSGGGSYSQLVCNRVYSHWLGQGPNNFVLKTLYEVPDTASFTDCWAVDDTTPSGSILPLVSGPGTAAALVGTNLMGFGAAFINGMDINVINTAVNYPLHPAFWRSDNYRSFTNPSPGVYDFSLMDPFLARMQSLGQKYAMILFYGSDPWDHDVTGASAWAKASAQHVQQNYPGLLKYIEVWNEGDGAWPITPAELVPLTSSIRAAIRTDSSLNNIPISGGVATSMTAWSYWIALVADGLLTACDQISVHDYGNAETPLLYYPRWHAILQNTTLPVYVSEWGAYAENVITRIPCRLSYYKKRGIEAATYYIISDFFGYDGILETAGAAALWLGWYNAIGPDALFVGEDALDPITYSYIYSKGGTTVRHLFARKSSIVLVDGVATTLTRVPLYLTGTHTVARHPTEYVLADVDFDFSINVPQGQPWTYLTRLPNGTDERLATTITDLANTEYWDEASEAGGYFGNEGVQASGLTRQAIRRYTVPSGITRVMVDGNVYMSASSSPLINVYIERNGTRVFTKEGLTAGEFLYPIFMVFDVVAGDKIDLVTYTATPGTTTEVTFYECSIRATAHPLSFNLASDFRIVDVLGAPFHYLARNNDDSGEEKMIIRTDTLDAYGRLGDYACLCGPGGRMVPTATKKAVTRWISPGDYSVRVQGTVSRPATTGDGTHVKIIAAGITRVSKLPLVAADGNFAIDFTTFMEAGDFLEFEAASGGTSAVGDDVFWSITITPTISTDARAIVTSVQLEVPRP